MLIDELKKYEVPEFFINYNKKKGIIKLNPGQEKAINAGLFSNRNLLVCTPTGSGKTLIATLAILNALKEKNAKVVYTVPLKALAYEKYKEYSELFNGTEYKVIYSTGDQDNKDLSQYDLLILTVEKLDSLLRSRLSWLKEIKLLIVDEIHLLNDPSRGPTVEVVITLLKHLLPNLHIISLSATIGNPEELAEWLDAELVVDDWRPVKLEKGVMCNHTVEFIE